MGEGEASEIALGAGETPDAGNSLWLHCSQRISEVKSKQATHLGIPPREPFGCPCRPEVWKWLPQPRPWGRGRQASPGAQLLRN